MASPLRLRDRERTHPALLGLVVGLFAIVCVLVPAAPAEASPRECEPSTVLLDLRPSRLWARRDALLRDPTEADIACRERELMQEISTLVPRHPWAGQYYRGDGLGVNIRLLVAPRSGALVTWRGCTGLYGWNWGPVTTDADTLHIEFQMPTDSGIGSGFAANYHVAVTDCGVVLEEVGRHGRLTRDM